MPQWCKTACLYGSIRVPIRALRVLAGKPAIKIVGNGSNNKYKVQHRRYKPTHEQVERHKNWRKNSQDMVMIFEGWFILDKLIERVQTFPALFRSIIFVLRGRCSFKLLCGSALLYRNKVSCAHVPGALAIVLQKSSFLIFSAFCNLCQNEASSF